MIIGAFNVHCSFDISRSLPHGLIFTSITIIMCRMTLLIHPQTSTVQPLKFVNGKVISTHTLRGMRLLFHAEIKVKPCLKGPQVSFVNSKFVICSVITIAKLCAISRYTRLWYIDSRLYSIRVSPHSSNNLTIQSFEWLWPCDVLSLLGLKLNHVCERGHSSP